MPFIATELVRLWECRKRPSANLMHCKNLHSAKEHSKLTLGLRLKLNY